MNELTCRVEGGQGYGRVAGLGSGHLLEEDLACDEIVRRIGPALRISPQHAERVSNTRSPQNKTQEQLGLFPASNCVIYGNLCVEKVISVLGMKLVISVKRRSGQ